MTEKEQQPVTPEIPTEAADKPESDNPPKNENRRGANQAERERTIAQNRQRLREIVDVVRKHDILHGITPEKLCAIIEDLGPTFIKLGQILYAVGYSAAGLLRGAEKAALERVAHAL